MNAVMQIKGEKIQVLLFITRPCTREQRCFPQRNNAIKYLYVCGKHLFLHILCFSTAVFHRCVHRLPHILDRCLTDSIFTVLLGVNITHFYTWLTSPLDCMGLCQGLMDSISQRCHGKRSTLLYPDERWQRC